MREDVDERLRDLAKRAGLGDVSPRVVVAGMAVLGVALALAAWRWWPRGAETPILREPPVASAASQVSTAGAVSVSTETSSTARIWVHVVGAVRHPGLYDLPLDSRVQGAVDAAGGVLGNAAPEAVNLARRVADGEQVVIPTQDEVGRGYVSAGRSGGGGVSAAGSVGGNAGPVELNSASAEQLDTLPGIGPATAAKIVADREDNGPFTSVDDLGRVAGIGPKKLEELRELVCVR